MVQINWTRQSVNDLREIFEFISKDSRRYAQLQVTKIQSRTTILRGYPLSGRVVPEIGDVQIRELIEGNYRIIYKCKSDDQVDVLAVHHSSKQL